MESIIFFLILLVFRAIGSQIFESQKNQNPSTPKTPAKPKEITQTSVQNEVPKIIPIEEVKIAKAKPRISPIHAENNRLEKSSRQIMALENDMDQSENPVNISELFSQENILRGIILQEILSPPKALMRR